MSFDGLAWAWKTPLTSSTCRLVLVYLSGRAGNDGLCWPSQQTIATDCALSPRAVFDALKTLEESEKIKRTRRMLNGVRSSDLIEILFSRMVLFENGPVADPGTKSASEVEMSDTKSATRPETPPELPAPSANSPDAYSQMAPKLLAPDATESTNESPEESLGREPAPALTREADLDVLAARIYDASSEVHKAKCHHDPSKIVFALRDAVRRGEDPARITDAMIALVTSGDQLKQNGRFASSPARLIDDNRWTLWVNRKPSAAPARDLSLDTVALTEITHEGVVYAIPPGGSSQKVGTYEHPGIGRQLHIMAMWNKRLSDWDAKKWGPPPGAQGCRLWPSVLERIKHESVGQAPVAANVGTDTVAVG